MKILIGYPPTESEKGTATLGQNRQFQWFTNPCIIYPIVPATAATLLKKKGHEVLWYDCIAEGIDWKGFIKIIEKESPDLFAFETKTPVIKMHWKLINELKERFPKMKVVIMGDHVTNFPAESMKESKVDFVICGGDFDFMLGSLVDYLEDKIKNKIPKGIYYRDKGLIMNTGKFELKCNLDDLPIIDRELTKWWFYQKEYNLIGRPFFYIMSGRDCWWGKCKFCLAPETRILTNKGNIKIKDIENIIRKEKDIKVLTHKGEYQSIKRTFKRDYNNDIIEIEVNALKNKLKLTSNHKLFAIKKNQLESKKIDFIKSIELDKGDYIAIPKITKIKDMKEIDIERFLEENPIKIETTKLKPINLIGNILRRFKRGESQRKISRELRIDRETVKRYIDLDDSKEIQHKTNPLIRDNDFIRFQGAKNNFLRKIPLNKDFLRLVGYYLAEGHVFKSKNRPNSYTIGFTFSEKEEEYINDVVNICKTFFKQTNVSVVYNRFNHTVQITMYNSILGIFFKILFGKDCYNKKIPQDFIYLPFYKQKELLKGLFRGDGHLRIRKKGQGGSEYILETVSETLAQQVILILHRNNAVPRLKILEPRQNNESIKYHISLCQYDIQHIFPEIKLPKRTLRMRKGKVLDNYILVPIKNITKKKYNGQVYNLEVEKDHSYIANNLTVSNCAWPSLFPSFRVRSVENVLDEIGMLIEKYDVKEIFDDSGTLMTGRWLKDLCEGLIERGYNKKIKYSCNMRFGVLKQEDYNLMKRAGFRLLKFGLESANQETLERLDKGIKVRNIKEGCEMAHRAGLTVHLTMIVGYPWESKEDALNTFKLAKKLMQSGKADLLQATVLIPYPGTPLWKEAMENNWLLFDSKEYERYDQREPVLKVKNGSPEEVAAITKKIYTIFLTPQYILARIKGINNWEDFKFNLRGVKAVFGHLSDFSSRK